MIKQPHAVSDHDSLYLAGAELVWPHLRLSSRSSHILTSDSRSEISLGLRNLANAIRIRPGNPKNWSTLWLMGKAHEAMEEFEDAYVCFRNAFSLNPNNLDVTRELSGICIRTKRFSEALVAAEAARRLAPSNAGIVANLALALSLNSRPKEAIAVAQTALKLNPSDIATQELLKDIEYQIGK